MFSFRFFRRAAVAVGLWLCLLPALPGRAAAPRLTPEQETTLKQKLPRTLAKLQNRELIRVVSAGDSISTFYQPPGFPRYDSAMAWQGRLLSFLGGYFYYHGIVEVDPHREITASQKEAAAAWTRFEAEMQVWQRTKQGPAPEAPDTLRFRADLDSPVAMGGAELIRRGVPSAQQIVSGTAIQIHNLARDGAQAAQVLEALGPEAFPAAPAPGPDLVTICYGVNDSIGSLPLSGYRDFLTKAVKLCQDNKAEVLLAAPPVSFDPAQPRESLARTRPYAQVAAEVAKATGVAFVDLGAALVEAPSDLQSLTAADAFSAAMVPVARQFNYHSTVLDTLHPNAAAALQAGEHAARQLLGSNPSGPVQLSGMVELTGPATATANLRLFNPTAEARAIVVSPLGFTGWRVKAGTPDAYFNLPPSKARWLKLPLEPAITGPAPESGVIRASLLLSDDDRQQLADAALTLTPLSLTWPEGRFNGESGDMLLTPVLTNQSNQPVKGNATLQWMGRNQVLPIQLEPRQSLPLPLRLVLPDASTTDRFNQTATVQITLADRELHFHRHIDGIRHLGLEQRLPLSPVNSVVADPPAAPDTFVTPFADTGGVYLIIDSPASGGTAGQAGTPWGIIDVQLDGRKAGENGTAGFVDRLSATIPWSDGPVALRKVRPAVFGHTYHYDYNPKGFRVSATTRADGSRRIEFNIARVNLPQHEWSLDGSGQSSLGINLRITRSDPVSGQHDLTQSRLLAPSPFGSSDARSLTLLELSRTPAPRWSIQVY